MTDAPARRKRTAARAVADELASPDADQLTADELAALLRLEQRAETLKTFRRLRRLTRG